MKKKILVLADDLSGAVEIAGVLSRYISNITIELHPTFTSDADAVVVDTNTRSLLHDNVRSSYARFIPKIKAMAVEYVLFKKIDSVFRGHILEETKELLDAFDIHRVFLLPANPQKERKIIDGNYLIDGIELQKTAFNNDPDFPRVTCRVAAVLDYHSFPLQHHHLSKTSTIPDKGLFTADITSMDDLRYYASQYNENTLFCGGADCCEAFCQSVFGWTSSIKERTCHFGGYATFFINGSTIKQQTEEQLLQSRDITLLDIPGTMESDRYAYENNFFNEWIAEAARLIKRDAALYFTVGQPVVRNRNVSNSILEQLVVLANRLLQLSDGNRVHFALTGGATASAILRDWDVATIKVVKMHAGGVVTVRPPENDSLICTIKPGSYSWPQSLIELLCHEK
jgi:D-threonate/D-erythronate kinase